MSSEERDASEDSELENSSSDGEKIEDEAGPSIEMADKQSERTTKEGDESAGMSSEEEDESEDEADDDDEDDDSIDDDDSSDDDDDDDGNDEKEDENKLLPEVKLPKSITCDEDVVALQFHPKGNMLAAGLIDGSITLYSYSAEEPNEELMFEEVHKKACRAVSFSEDGRSLFSISKDKSICKLDVATAVVEMNVEKAHNDPIYSLAVIDENLLATGDDDGHLKVWDLRTETSIMEMKENEEFISSLVVGKDKKILLATSGDGTMSAFNVRRRRFDLQSEHLNSELHCASLIRKGQKVVCGASDGALNIFNWNEFGNISDRFPGHSSSIDCCVPVTENVLCTGCIDGTIRAVHMLPNRFIGIVGEHEGLPVESMTVSFDSLYLASCALEDKVRFWGVEHLQKTKVDPRGKAGKNDSSKRLTETGKQDNFFADL